MFVPKVRFFSVSLLVCEFNLIDKHGTKNFRALSAFGVPLSFLFRQAFPYLFHPVFKLFYCQHQVKRGLFVKDFVSFSSHINVV